MVKEVSKEGKTIFQCEACGMFFKERELAEKCEKFCNENKACSIEITKHAIK